MKLSSNGNKVHLTYCLNVHPGENWDDVLSSIKTYALHVRDVVAGGDPFGLGLRLGFQSAKALARPAIMENFKSFLDKENLYVFTINGFPYGPFHGQPVKQEVYEPDWRTSERCEYTKQLIDVMAELVPDGMTGSISTVPCSYKAWIRSEDDKALMVRNLVDCAEYMTDVMERTGKEIHLGLEPEPDCFLETTRDVISFFEDSLMEQDPVRKHIGVCFDTCHLAVQFEDLSESLEEIIRNGIRISKIQISSAIKRTVDAGCVEAVGQFNDPVYLHQVKARKSDGQVCGWPDLPAFMNDVPGMGPDVEECRVHCHVPLYFEGNGLVESTSSDLTPSFFRCAAHNNIEHLEMETYTFNVLPAELRARGVVNSVTDEYRWVLNKIS